MENTRESFEIEQISLTREVGKNIPTLIAGLAASSKVSSIEELIANSYDSDAAQVDIIHDSQKNELIISDDGEGMTPEQLAHFFRLGDSVKIQERISPKGRLRMGKFGIATILIYDLANEYFMETTGEGKTSFVHEQFGETIRTGESIPITVKPADENLHGTRITLKNLKLDNQNFSINELERRLKWDFPIFLPDFKITLNSKILEPTSIDAERRYEIPPNNYVDDVGTISGQFHYTLRPNPNHGFHIYVNGRRVGNPKALFQGFFRSDVQSRVVGIIHANGLEEAILFDRGRFKEDHPAFLSFTNEVKRLLRKIDSDIRRRSLKALHQRSAQNARNVIKHTEGLINSKLKDEIGTDITIKVVPNSQIEAIRGEQNVVINSPSIYDGKGKVFIDEASPGLTIGVSLDKLTYHTHLLHKSIEAIVHRQLIDMLRKDHSTPFNIETFLAMKEAMLAKFFGAESHVSLSSMRETRSRKSTDDAGINDIRRYTHSELSQLIGRPIGIIKEMARLGLMGEKEGKDETILGQNAIDTFRKIEGHTSLYELFHAMANTGVLAKNNITQNYRNFLSHLTERNINLAYMLNIGSNGTSCFFIMDEFAKEVKSVLSEPNLQLDERLRKLAELDPMITLQDIAKRLKISLSDVASAVDYAVRKDMTLKVDKGDGGQGFKYRYFHVLKAYRAMQTERD